MFHLLCLCCRKWQIIHVHISSNTEARSIPTVSFIKIESCADRHVSGGLPWSPVIFTLLAKCYTILCTLPLSLVLNISIFNGFRITQAIHYMNEDACVTKYAFLGCTWPVCLTGLLKYWINRASSGSCTTLTFPAAMPLLLQWAQVNFSTYYLQIPCVPSSHVFVLQGPLGTLSGCFCFMPPISFVSKTNSCMIPGFFVLFSSVGNKLFRASTYWNWNWDGGIYNEMLITARKITELFRAARSAKQLPGTLRVSPTLLLVYWFSPK